MFAVTERLLLRPGWTEDAPELTVAIGHQEIADVHPIGRVLNQVEELLPVNE